MTDPIYCPQCGKVGSIRDLPPSFLYCNEHLYFATLPEMKQVVALVNTELEKELK